MMMEADMGIILKIPRESESLIVGITVTDAATGKEKHGSIRFDKDDIDEMRQDFLENVELGDNYDDVYMLTDIGLEFCKVNYN